MTAPNPNSSGGGGGASAFASSSCAFPPLSPLLPTRAGAGRLRSGFSTQVLSVHVTSPSASFGSSEQRPRTRGSEGGGSSGGGGGLSPRPAAFGRQADSTRPSAPSPGFGKGVRRLGGDAPPSSPARPLPPGPGAYLVSAAEAANKRAAPRFVFGQSARDSGRRACDAEARAMGGSGGGGGGNADTPPPGSYTPLGALGGRQPTRPAAPAARFGGGAGGRPQAAAASAASGGGGGDGVPGVGLYSDGASAAALSLVSTHRCAPAHSFGARGGFVAGRKAAAAGARAAASPPPSPGPADAPALAAASARQVLSTLPNAPRAGFGHAPRVGLAAAAERAAVPGPGTYDA